MFPTANWTPTHHAAPARINDRVQLTNETTAEVIQAFYFGPTAEGYVFLRRDTSRYLTAREYRGHGCFVIGDSNWLCAVTQEVRIAA